MLYINAKFNFWLKIIIPLMFFFQIFYFFIFNHLMIPALSKFDIFYTLNYIGAYLGLGGLLFFLSYRASISIKLFLFFIFSGLFIYLFIYLFNLSSVSINPISNFLVVLAPFGFFIFIKSFFLNFRPYRALYLKYILLFSSLGLLTQSALEISGIIFPKVNDINVYKIDAAFGNFPNNLFIWFDAISPFFKTVVFTVYASLSLILFVIFSLIVREGKAENLHIVRTLVVPFFLAFICYSFLPVSGPIYALDPNFYPENMPSSKDIIGGGYFIPPAPRNGMPSMHLTGAFFIILLASSLRKKTIFYFSIIFFMITVLATLGLGEHYFLDLIVAVPFAAFIGIGLTNPDNFIFKNKKNLILWVSSGATFFFWMLLLFVASGWLSRNLLFVQIFTVWSLVVAFALFATYIKFVWHDMTLGKSVLGIEQLMLKEKADMQITPRWVIGVFVASGFAGLLYEVVYAKSLAVTFGSTSLASYTVLTTYMSGMALGAWVGGYIADKIKKPLLWYAGIEAFIGLYAVITPFLFKLIQNIYVLSVTDMVADAPEVTFLRVALGVVVLGIPTILMGATMPIMFKFLKNMDIQSDTAISRLYSANVIGAALGSFVGGYFFIPMIGRIGATNLAAVFSLMIALYVIDQYKRRQHLEVAQPSLQSIDTPLTIPKVFGITALIILTIGGAVTLGLEVVSIHMLAVVAGNSLYAFALMLSVFLLGLGLGSVFGKKSLNYIDRSTLIIITQCGITASIIITALLWDKIPGYFASFGEMQNYIHIGFWAREILRGAVCALAMFPATLFIGACYPATMSLAADWIGDKGEAKGLGIASALNTFGNIMGVLLVGFMLLPRLGSNKVFLLLAVISLVLALLALICTVQVNKKLNPYAGSILVSILILFAIYPKSWNFTSLAQGANVYFTPTYWGEVIDHTESIEGGMTSVARSPDGKYMTLLTNGKFQGNNSGETLAQESFALIPLLHTSERKSALAIGYGTGMTARVLHEQGFQSLDVVELSKDIVFMANKYFSNINHNVISQPGVNLIYTDGRNYLLTEDKKYDLISLEITSIWFAGAANLYNKEFYELSKKRLEHNGILQQWVQLHHMHPIDLIYILNTVRSVYPYVWLYESGGQGVIVASDSEDAMNLHHLNYPYNGLSQKELFEKEKVLRSSIVLSPKGIDRLAHKTDKTLKHLISTDNNLYLEYATPKGNAIVGDALTQNLVYLRKFEE